MVDLKGISKTSALLMGGKRVFESKEGYNERVHKYHDPDFWMMSEREFLNRTRASEMATMDWVVGIICEAGGTLDDLETLVLYAYILMDAEKKHLNFMRAKNDLKISEMTENYYTMVKIQEANNEA